MKQVSGLLMAGACTAALLAGCGGGDNDDDSNEGGGSSVSTPTLTGRAVLPAATFAEGPTSGTRIGSGPINGQTVPFVDKQPVQGFSAIADNRDGSFLVMSDNGFGSLENSADYLLRVYHIRPDFKTKDGGSGGMTVIGHVQLRDPDRHIPFAITNHFSDERLLTGADFDIESMQRAPDGSLWFGDEFGPFLLHTSADGVVLEPPIPLPDRDNPGRFLRAPQNPLQEEASAIRIMNAVQAHAHAHGNHRTPVFSPYHVMLKYSGSDSSLHYARGNNPQPGLKPAAGDVFDVKSLQAAGYAVVTWTVNDKARMLELMQVGVNGIISDRPDLLLEAAREFDGNGDGKPDFITADGLIDISKFDAQGHRGGRNLRPENTLPAMEVALDYLMTTLETDSGITRDFVPILSHDPYIEAAKCRRTDGGEYTEANQVLIRDFTAAEIQAAYICDRVFRGDSQSNDRALSPVSVAFAAGRLADPYVMPTVQQLFDFVRFYIDYYQNGAGRDHPQAALRVKNAQRVRYNIETKRNPRSDRDHLGHVYRDRTVDAQVFADSLAVVIANNGLSERADIQSFDFSTLLRVQERFPEIRTVYLFGDFPIYPSPDSDDGTNLQDENGANTPWLAGLYWPYRETVQTSPFRVQRSGGFEGMALTADGSQLLPLLEKPLADSSERVLLIHEFDLATKQYSGVRYRYPLDARGTAIGDFIMIDATRGLIIERDDTQGDLNGYKTVQRITFQGAGAAVDKQPLVDLLKIADPGGLATGETGDVGVGGGTFAFPFVTIEDIVILGERTLGVLNDNNYPFSSGRHAGSKAPDDNEFIIIELPAALTAP